MSAVKRTQSNADIDDGGAAAAAAAGRRQRSRTQRHGAAEGAAGVERCGFQPPAAPPTAARPLIVGVYNYKGGAGKTTTAINLGCTLGHKFKKKVLMVDCDPQCNLTSFCFPDDTMGDDHVSVADDPGAEPDVDDEDDSDDGGADGGGAAASAQQGLPSSIVKGFPLPKEQGTGLDVEVIEKGHLQCKMNLYSALDRLINNQLQDDDEIDRQIGKITTTPFGNDPDRSNTYLVNGDPKIIIFEAMASAAEMVPNGHVVYGALRYFVLKACEKLGCEYAVLDFGPSASRLNTIWLSSCDAILPSAFPDYFNVASLHGLLHSVLPEVHKTQDKIRTKQKDARKAGYRISNLAGIPRRRPSLLVTCVSRFKLNCHAGSVDKGSLIGSNGRWVHTMISTFKNDRVSDEVINSFLPSGFNHPDAEKSVADRMVACILQDLQGTEQICHEMGIPVTMFGVHDEAYWPPGARTGKKQAMKQRKIAEKKFNSLGRYIENVRYHLCA